MYSHVIDWKQDCNIITAALMWKHSTQHSIMTIKKKTPATSIKARVYSDGLSRRVESFFSYRMNCSKWLFLMGEKLNPNISNDADCAGNTWTNGNEMSTGTALTI